MLREIIKNRKNPGLFIIFSPFYSAWLGPSSLSRKRRDLVHQAGKPLSYRGKEGARLGKEGVIYMSIAGARSLTETVDARAGEQSSNFFCQIHLFPWLYIWRIAVEEYLNP